MKTAEKILALHSKNFSDALDAGRGKQAIATGSQIIAAMKDYAEEAIKADREHLLNNIYYTLENGEKVINKHLLINAPNIILE